MIKIMKMIDRGLEKGSFVSEFHLKVFDETYEYENVVLSIVSKAVLYSPDPKNERFQEDAIILLKNGVLIEEIERFFDMKVMSLYDAVDVLGLSGSASSEIKQMISRIMEKGKGVKE